MPREDLAPDELLVRQLEQDRWSLWLVARRGDRVVAGASLKELVKTIGSRKKQKEEAA